MRTDRYLWLFWACVFAIAVVGANLVAGEKNRIVLLSDAPITVEGGGRPLGNFAPPPPEIATHKSCESDRIVLRVLAEHWDDGIEANVRYNRNFGFRATVALYQRCVGDQCPGLSFEGGVEAGLDEWLLWWYGNEIATARGGGERCGILRKQVAVGPNRNTFKCQMYCPSSGVCAGVLRELGDLEYLDEYEEGRCPSKEISLRFDLAGKGESLEAAEPDPAFNMAITSRRGSE